MSVLDEFRKKQKRVNIRAVFDIIMGIIYLLVGIALVLAKYAGFEFSFIRSELVIVFGVIAGMYGGFRIFRGIKTYNLVD
ncbi:MAG: hypothetical protein QM725_10435 [Lacibacter sp.]